MVALKGKSIEAALKKRDKAFHAFLVYGPDQGLVSERVTILAKHIIDDFSDPFNFMELSIADLKADPSRLSDEITALSFMGGERVIQIKITGEGSPPEVNSFLDALDKDHLKTNGIIIIAGGDLSPRSSLRKKFEKSKQAAALPCYVDGPAAIRSLAQQMATEHGLKFDNDALNLVLHILGSDRAITKSELEKLFLYKGVPSDTIYDTINLDDVRTCLVDNSGDAMNKVTAACIDGQAGPLANALHQSAMAGTSAVGLLRALQRNFSRLQQARQFMDMGESPNDAMKKLRPPVFFGEQDAFRQRLNIWSTAKLKLAKRLLIEAELDAKTTGSPQRELIERTALRLSRMVNR